MNLKKFKDYFKSFFVRIQEGQLPPLISPTTETEKLPILSKRVNIFWAFIIICLALILLLPWILSFFVSTNTRVATNISSEMTAPKVASPFDTISFEARAVYVFDVKTNTVLFAKNENEKLPLASVTKLMTTLLARENMPESATLTLTKDDLSTEGDSGLRPGERWRIGDLLRFMLIISSNDAAHAIGGFVGADGQPDKFSDMSIPRENFIKMMNAKALELNLSQMEFFNESGLDVTSTQSGGYGSAQNVAQLLLQLWKAYPETLEITTHRDARIYSENKIAHIIPNTDEIVGHIPGLIASKTGYTTLAGGNLAVIFDRGIGDPVVAVVLGSTYAGRFQDMQKIVVASRELGDSQE